MMDVRIVTEVPWDEQYAGWQQVVMDLTSLHRAAQVAAYEHRERSYDTGAWRRLVRDLDGHIQSITSTASIPEPASDSRVPATHWQRHQPDISWAQQYPGDVGVWLRRAMQERRSTTSSPRLPWHGGWTRSPSIIMTNVSDLASWLTMDIPSAAEQEAHAAESARSDPRWYARRRRPELLPSDVMESMEGTARTAEHVSQPHRMTPLSPADAQRQVSEAPHWQSSEAARAFETHVRMAEAMAQMSSDDMEETTWMPLRDTPPTWQPWFAWIDAQAVLRALAQWTHGSVADVRRLDALAPPIPLRPLDQAPQPILFGVGDFLTLAEHGPRHSEDRALKQRVHVLHSDTTTWNARANEILVLPFRATVPSVSYTYEPPLEHLDGSLLAMQQAWSQKPYATPSPGTDAYLHILVQQEMEQRRDRFASIPLASSTYAHAQIAIQATTACDMSAATDALDRVITDRALAFLRMLRDEPRRVPRPIPPLYTLTKLHVRIPSWADKQTVYAWVLAGLQPIDASACAEYEGMTAQEAMALAQRQGLAGMESASKEAWTWSSSSTLTSPTRPVALLHPDVPTSMSNANELQVMWDPPLVTRYLAILIVPPPSTASQLWAEWEYVYGTGWAGRTTSAAYDML